jgi:putative heme iron utilization protein
VKKSTRVDDCSYRRVKVAAVSTVESYASLLRRQFAGVLATHCVRLAGYPFASRVPYCPDPQGHPLLAVSALAQHTQNLRADARVALSIWDEHPDDVQAAARATLLGNIETAHADASSIYLEHFPAAAVYLRELDFTLYRLQVHKVHFIAGFASVHWLDDGDLADVPAWSIAERTRALAAVPGDSLRKLAETGADEVQLAGIDPQGLTVRCPQTLRRVAFPETLQSPRSIATTLAQLTA